MCRRLPALFLFFFFSLALPWFARVVEPVPPSLKPFFLIGEHIPAVSFLSASQLLFFYARALVCLLRQGAQTAPHAEPNAVSPRWLQTHMHCVTDSGLRVWGMNSLGAPVRFFVCCPPNECSVQLYCAPDRVYLSRSMAAHGASTLLVALALVHFAGAP
jgi:hypothetical protein